MGRQALLDRFAALSDDLKMHMLRDEAMRRILESYSEESDPSEHDYRLDRLQEELPELYDQHIIQPLTSIRDPHFRIDPSDLPGIQALCLSDTPCSGTKRLDPDQPIRHIDMPALGWGAGAHSGGLKWGRWWSSLRRSRW